MILEQAVERYKPDLTTMQVDSIATMPLDSITSELTPTVKMTRVKGGMPIWYLDNSRGLTPEQVSDIYTAFDEFTIASNKPVSANVKQFNKQLPGVLNGESLEGTLYEAVNGAAPGIAAAVQQRQGEQAFYEQGAAVLSAYRANGGLETTAYTRTDNPIFERESITNQSSIQGIFDTVQENYGMAEKRFGELYSAAKDAMGNTYQSAKDALTFKGQSRLAKQGGFTLIELLAVIGIIAVLSAILFPVFSRAREKARQASCMSNLKQIGLAMTMYSDDNDELLMRDMAHPSSWSDPSENMGAPNMGGNWEVVMPYAKNEQIFLCPSFKNVQPTSGSHTNTGYLETGQVVFDPDIDKNRVAMSVGDIYYASKTAVAADYPVKGDIMHYVGPLTEVGVDRNQTHNTGVNALFADGHVKINKELDWSDDLNRPGGDISSTNPMGDREYLEMLGDF